MGPSQLGFFGYGPPLSFPARARSGRAKVFVINDQVPDPDSFYSGSVVRSGDYVDVERLSEPNGYQVTMAASGLTIIKAHGDLNRQLVHAELYSRHIQMWTGDSGQYVNNRPPTGTLTTLELVSGVAPGIIDLLQLFNDSNGDVLQLKSVTGATPTGMTLTGQFLVGIPTTAGSGSFQVVASDPPGDFGVSRVDWMITAQPVQIDAGSLTETVRVKTNVGGALVGS